MIPFNYDLPLERIAQRPVQPAEAAKLLTVSRDGSLRDAIFRELPSLLRSSDLLILNDTKVLPARLFGRLETGAEVELLMVQKFSDRRMRCLARPLKKLKLGTRIILADGAAVEVCGFADSPMPCVDVESKQEIGELLGSAGTMPIPPYIRKGRGDEQDKADYQTEFAEKPGSIAAPTASLHFSGTLLRSLKEAGVGISYLTLHVGAASFLPLWDESESAPSKTPGREALVYDPELLEQCEKTKQRGGRVIAVGTTSVRALETMARAEKRPGMLDTELFIQPGFEFKIVDGLITNFHQPRTTHLLLVEALLGRAALERAYAHALERGYRFLSYGDGMLILS